MAEQEQLADNAFDATARIYSDVLSLGRACTKKRCRRLRCCRGDPFPCLRRGLPSVPPQRLERAKREVIAGGPRRPTGGEGSAGI